MINIIISIFSLVFFYLIIFPLGYVIRMFNLNKIKVNYNNVETYWLKKRKKLNHIKHMLRKY